VFTKSCTIDMNTSVSLGLGFTPFFYPNLTEVFTWAESGCTQCLESTAPFSFKPTDDRSPDSLRHENHE
jgi:hypothetical protein